MNKNKLWSILCLLLTLVLLLTAAGVTVYIDPYFHFHKPLDNLEYPIHNQRYQNDGIVRHFEYDALITGTSMTENFKSSEFDALFGVTSVKVPFSGGSFGELFQNLEQAIRCNAELKTVLFCLDEWFLLSGKNMILADGGYPTYLYDDNPFNDVEYLLNKDALCSDALGVLEYTAKGKQTTSFDSYSSWVYPYSKEAVLNHYQRPEPANKITPFSQWNEESLRTNLANTAVKAARENPDIQFYYYFPPYSILNWDSHLRTGTLEQTIGSFRLASQILLEEPNIHLFSFYTDYETITDLDNYRDTVHHSDAVNSLLLQRMHAGEYQLTKENYEQHWQEVQVFYTSYDYDAIFAE